MTIKQKIVIHVSYRNIFNAPVKVGDCQNWLGIKEYNLDGFRVAVNELKNEGLISEKNGFLCVKGYEETVDLQSEKDQLSKALLAKGNKTLMLISKLPFIRYIGVSGSVAANNPTPYSRGKYKGSVDLDLFVICRFNCLWIFFLIERVVTNIKKAISGHHHFYCFNYVTDESFLEVYNKNFYTATEITNLKTIYNEDIYLPFIEENRWSENFYPQLTKFRAESKKKRPPIWTFILAPLNFLCFAAFCLGRAIKRFEIAPLLEVFGGFNPIQKCNLKRISNPNGGYQEAIKNRFKELYQRDFPGYFSDAIIEDLFPSSTAFTYYPEHNVHDSENAELFAKYTLSSNEKNSI